MKLYLIERTDNWWYDDYKATVVAAPSESIARRSALELFNNGYTPSSDGFIDVTLLAENSLCTEGIILSSFNAG